MGRSTQRLALRQVDVERAVRRGIRQTKVALAAALLSVLIAVAIPIGYVADSSKPAGDDVVMGDWDDPSPRQASPTSASTETTTTQATTTEPPVEPCLAVGGDGTFVSGTRGDPHVEDVSVDVTNLNDPQVELAGRLVGGLGASEGLYPVRTANRDTRDATADRNPGSSNYWLQDELSVDSYGCWHYPSRRVAYSCAGGVEFRFRLMVISDSKALSLMGQRSDGGMDPGLFANDDPEIRDPEIRDLGYVRVPTPVDPNCPGA